MCPRGVMDSVQAFEVCGEGSSPSGGTKNMKNKRSNIKNLALLTVFLFSSLIPLPVIAGLVPCGGSGQPACQLCHLFVMVDNIIDYLFTYIVPPVALLVIVIGGISMITAGGEPEKVNRAKKIITATVIGLAIIFLALAFLYTFLDIVGVAEWTGLKSWRLGDWWRIDCP
jgi:amino acid transporter